MRKINDNSADEYDRDDKLIFRFEEGELRVDAILPTIDEYLLDFPLDWGKFKKCASSGFQVRVQHDEFRIDMSEQYIYFHTNESGAFLGLVKDMAIYASASHPTAAIRCQHRIGHGKIASTTDIQEECIMKLFNCFKKF